MSTPSTKTSQSLNLLLNKLLQKFARDHNQLLPDDLLGMGRKAVEKSIIQVTLEHNAFNLSQSAQHLGIARKTLYAKIRNHDIAIDRPPNGSSKNEASSLIEGEERQPRPLRVLISVSDKTGLVELCQVLRKYQFQILATAGTARALSQAGIEHETVEDLTDMAEMMDGRVKTLHPNIFAPILARLPQDEPHLHQHHLLPIDVVIVNLYPFARVVANPEVSYQQACENIDIGGVALLRAAAKNHSRLSVLCHPDQYKELINTLESASELDENKRRRWAQIAFAHTSAYDRAIQSWLFRYAEADKTKDEPEGELPEHIQLDFPNGQALRYGENPHQAARLYLDTQSPQPWQQLQGRAASYNNLVDSDCAARLVIRLPSPACVIVKHDTPCAVALGQNSLDSFQRAFATDAESSFGGIIAFNSPVDESVAKEITERVFTEIIIAPEFSEASIEIFARKKNLRLFAYRAEALSQDHMQIKRVLSGYLMQEAMDTQIDPRAVGKIDKPELLTELMLAWQVVAFTHSNAIVAVCDQRTVGICGGATSRVRAVHHALESAESFRKEHKESNAPVVLASDAFFPFRDSVDRAAQSGVSAIVQPGGSINDSEVIDAADEHGIAIYTTGKRVFRH